MRERNLQTTVRTTVPSTSESLRPTTPVINNSYSPSAAKPTKCLLGTDPAPRNNAQKDRIIPEKQVKLIPTANNEWRNLQSAVRLGLQHEKRKLAADLRSSKVCGTLCFHLRRFSNDLNRFHTGPHINQRHFIALSIASLRSAPLVSR
jgi:hypothetical protein